MNDLLTAAYAWLNQGVSVIPIRYRSKLPEARLLPMGPAGERTWEPYQHRLPVEEELERWFLGELHNLAVVTGWNHLVVIDFDEQDLFFSWWAGCQVKTYMVLTGRGVHAYFFTDEAASARKMQGIDVKAAGGYVLAPPSVHPSGAPYSVLWNAPIARIRSVDQVLPEYSRPASSPKVAPKAPAIPVASNDPWATANNPVTWQPGEDLISKIKKNVSLLQFFPDARPTSPDGRWYMARCPLHDDHNPSLWIDARRGVCGCHAGCNHGKAMDVINLVGRLNHMSDPEAIHLLAGTL